MMTPNRKVLIIDDDDIFRRMLVGVFAFAEYEIAEAPDGRRAISTAEEFEPDLIIVDIILSEIDGLEVITVLKKKLPDARFIAICGGGRIAAGDYLYVAKKMGAHAVLEKPFEQEVLMALVDELFAGKGSATGTKAA